MHINITCSVCSVLAVLYFRITPDLRHSRLTMLTTAFMFNTARYIILFFVCVCNKATRTYFFAFTITTQYHIKYCLFKDKIYHLTFTLIRCTFSFIIMIIDSRFYPILDSRNQ